MTPDRDIKWCEGMLVALKSIPDEGSNPIIHQIKKVLLAFLETRIDLLHDTGERSSREYQLWRASLRAALDSLARIDDATWNQWTDSPKAVFLEHLEETYRKTEL